MTFTPAQKRKITKAIVGKFNTFGGNQKSIWNPIVNAMTGKPYRFAVGVSVKKVIECVLENIN